MIRPKGQIKQCFQSGGGGRTRTYEGVSQRIYSPPPLPLGTLPRRLTLHPDGCIQGRQGRFYGEPMAQCQPRLPAHPKQGRRRVSTASTRRRSLPSACGRGTVATKDAMRRPGPHIPDTRPPRKRDHMRKRDHSREAERRPWQRRDEAPHSDAVILYGWHTVKAALDNPARRIRRLYATENAARRLTADGEAPRVTPEVVRPDAIARRLGPDAVHNGLLAEADPLPSPELEDIAPAVIVLVLDQITDPHNVGAILRTAAGFAVNAVGTTARHSPEA